MTTARLSIVALLLALTGASCSTDFDPARFGKKKSAKDEDAGETSRTFKDRKANARKACDGLAALVGSGSDAGAKINECIDATPDDGVLELPPGVYTIATQVALKKSVTITTAGKLGESSCGVADGHGCAELKAASSLVTPYGVLFVSAADAVVDHIVLNGNRDGRPDARALCRTADDLKKPAGFNARMISCPGCAFVSSASKNAPCGTGLEVAGVNERISVVDSDFAGNGVHHVQHEWADGLTVHDVSDGEFKGNRFSGNTDVDLIFGGCQRCVIADNTVTHVGTYETGVFAAIMIHAFKTSTSGRYDGTVIKNNSVDCGGFQACGYGLYVGSRSWYEANRTVGGRLEGNVVSNSQGGILIGLDVTGMEIGDNDAGPSNGQVTCNTRGGPREYHALAVETGSDASFVGSRVGRAQYVDVLYPVGAEPNSVPGCTPAPGRPASPPAQPPAATPPATPPSGDACPAPHRAMVANRHAGGAVQCVPSCGQAGVDAGRAGAHLAIPNRADARVAADVAQMCALNNLDYLFSYEEVTLGQVCCVLR